MINKPKGGLRVKIRFLPHILFLPFDNALVLTLNPLYYIRYKICSKMLLLCLLHRFSIGTIVVYHWNNSSIPLEQ